MSEYVEFPRGECFGEFVLMEAIICILKCGIKVQRASGRGKQDVCPHAPERSMDAAHSRAGGASPSPTVFCNCINLTRGAQCFSVPFVTKGTGGLRGQRPRYSARSAATPCGARQTTKSAKGGFRRLRTATRAPPLTCKGTRSVGQPLRQLR